MPEINKFEKRELSREILSEWYNEKGISLENLEKEKKEEVAPPEFTFSTTTQATDNLKEEEESKKLLVKRKIKYLLATAEKKGLEHSIKEARKENDPFLLDVYHDVLAKDGNYKKILKK